MIFVAKSKTDQFEIGITIVVGKARNAAICPIRLYKKWTDSHPFPKSEWLFTRLDDDRPLNEDTPRSIIKNMLRKSGYDDEKYGGHSARKGGATAAAAARVQVHLLKRHGRWKSDAVYLYIHDSPTAKLSVSRAILNPTPNQPPSASSTPTPAITPQTTPSPPTPSTNPPTAVPDQKRTARTYDCESVLPAEIIAVRSSKAKCKLCTLTDKCRCPCERCKSDQSWFQVRR